MRYDQLHFYQLCIAVDIYFLWVWNNSHLKKEGRVWVTKGAVVLAEDFLPAVEVAFVLARDALLRVLNNFVLPFDSCSLWKRDLELPVELALHPKLHPEELVPLAEDYVPLEAARYRWELPLEVVQSVFDIFRSQRFWLAIWQIDDVRELLDLRWKALLVFASVGDGSTCRRSLTDQIFFRSLVAGLPAALLAAVASHWSEFFKNADKIL